MAGHRPFRELFIYNRWYALRNDVIGGWCVMPANQPPSWGIPEVADFVSEQVASHIADLHNEWLERRVHDYVDSPVVGGTCLHCGEPESALQHPPANAKTPPVSRDGETGGDAVMPATTP